MRTILIITAVFLLSAVSLKMSAQAPLLNLTFSPLRTDTAAGTREFDILVGAGNNIYSTNNNIYAYNTNNTHPLIYNSAGGSIYSFNPYNPNGSYTMIKIIFTQSGSSPLTSSDFTVGYGASPSGITNSRSVADVLVGNSGSGCYENQPAFAIDVYRDRPGIDAQPSTSSPYIVATVQYPNTHPNQTLTIRNTGTLQSCNSMESYWVNGCDTTMPCTPLYHPVIGGYIVLPVTITSLSAKVVNCAGLINWSTTGESNLSRYVIERSTNAKDFKMAGQVTAHNNLQADYSFTDYNLASGTVYYRIRTVDLNGSSKLSEVVNVKNSCNQNTIEIYPNPSKTLVNVRGINAGNTINIYDVAGKLLSSSISNANSAVISMSKYTKGIYIVHVLNGASAITTLKIVKE